MERRSIPKQPPPSTDIHDARRRGDGLRCASLLLLACFLIPGCGAPEHPSRPDAEVIAMRFIAEDPEILFNDDGLFAEEPVFQWQFRYPWDILWWTLGATSAAFPRDSDYIVFTPAGRYPRLTRNAQIDTEPIDVIRVVGEGLSRDWSFYWKRPKERESKDRAIRAQPRDTDREGVRRWDFVVAGHPLWTGHLLGMQLQPVVEPRQKFMLHSLSGIHLRLDTARLERMTERPWKVDIKRDVRNALLILPGNSVTRSLTVPEEADLQFAYGFVTGVAPPHAADPIRYRVSITPSGGETATLYEGKIEPILKGTGAPRWQDRSIDLRPYAGQEVELHLETVENATWQAMHGFPFWANPEVIQREPRAVSRDGREGANSTPVNVILISLDTLRADHLSLYGYERNTSPNIDAWARRIGVTFEHAIVQGPWTLPSHASIFTGLDAFHHRANYSPVPPDLTMLAEILRRTGRTTIGITGGGYVGPAYGFAQGFDRYVYWEGNSAFEMTDGIRRATAWMQENADRPFFMFFHTFEIHSPFRPHQPYAESFGATAGGGGDGNISLRPVAPTAADAFRTRRKLVWSNGSESRGGSLTDEQQASVLALYDSGIAHADALLVQLFTTLSDLDLEHDTLVVLTSDHGEAFGEDDLVGHGYLTESVLRVPLVIAFPRAVGSPRIVPTQVRSIDIVPTILDLLGLPAPAPVDGVSLVPLMRGGGPDAPSGAREAWTYAASSNYGVSLQIDGEMQYVFNNTPWEPVRGAESFRRPRAAIALESDPPDAPALRARMRAVLDGRPGFRLRFANAGAQPFEGTFRGAGINNVRVKSPDMTCPCARWDGGLVFTVPPGQTYTVLLENVERDPLHLVLRWPTEGGFDRRRYDIDPAGLTAPRAIVRRDGEWIEDGSGAPPDTGVRVWWHGTPHVDGAARPLSGAQRDQLRALGYVE